MVTSFRETMYPGKFNDTLSPLLYLYGPLILPFTPTEEFSFFFEGGGEIHFIC